MSTRPMKEGSLFGAGLAVLLATALAVLLGMADWRLPIFMGCVALAYALGTVSHDQEGDNG